MLSPVYSQLELRLKSDAQNDGFHILFDFSSISPSFKGFFSFLSFKFADLEEHNSGVLLLKVIEGEHNQAVAQCYLYKGAIEIQSCLLKLCCKRK